MGRIIVFGDIHGCYQEWKDLMSLLEISSEDRLIAVGDLVAKGPSTAKTLDLAMKLKNFQCVMGNHDYYLLKNWQAGCLEELSGTHLDAVREMGDDIAKYMAYIASWPFYLELSECIVVHAGLRPGIPLSEQDPHDLIHLRMLEKENRPWYELYSRKKTVVFGHWARKGLIIRDNVVGLDTGCVYGRQLSACVFPGRKIVSVPARESYAPK